MNNFLQDYILWWRKVLANNQSIQATLGDQCIGHILEEDAANHSTIAFPPMCTKLDKVAAQISFSRIHYAMEGDMIFCRPIGNQVFWDRTTSKCCKKDILKLCQHLKVHRFMQQDFPFCIPNTEPFTKQMFCKPSSTGCGFAFLWNMHLVGLAYP